MSVSNKKLGLLLCLASFCITSCKFSAQNGRSEDEASDSAEDDESAADTAQTLESVTSANQDLSGSGTDADPYTLSVFAGTSATISLDFDSPVTLTCTGHPSFVTISGSDLIAAPAAGSDATYSFYCQASEDGDQIHFDIIVTTPTLALTGDSASSASISARSFAFANGTDSAWTLSGSCVPGGGDVILSGDIGAVSTSTGYLEDDTYTTTCNDAAFSIDIYPTASATVPYVNSAFGGKNLTVTQGSDTTTTRLFVYKSGETVVEASTAAELTTALTNANDDLVILTANVDLSEVSATNNWTTVANTNPLSFDGNGYTISNLHIDDAGTDGKGLIAANADANFSNLNIDGYIRGRSFVGGLVGQMSGIIRHVVANMQIIATGNTSMGAAGGLTGSTASSGITVQNVSLSGSIDSGGHWAGAVSGYGANAAETIIIYDTVSTIDITTSNTWQGVGGLFGQHVNSSSTIIITRSHADGVTLDAGSSIGGILGSTVGAIAFRAVSTSGSSTAASGYIGGLVGAAGTNAFTIDNCYSTMSLNTSGGGFTRLGGFVSQSHTNHNVSDSYYSGAINNSGGSMTGTIYGNSTNAPASTTSLYYLGSATCDGCDNNSFGTSKSDAELKQEATFIGWDFDDVWQISEGASYPTLRR